MAKPWAVTLDCSNAPNSVGTLWRLASKDCMARVHRAEAVPYGRDGPPYGLVQASIDDHDGLLKALTHEGSQQIVRGSVCLIGKTSDIFVSLMPHPGWESSMTVIGSMPESGIVEAVEPLLLRPIHDFVHPKYKTVMALLDKPLRCRLTVAGDPVTAPASNITAAPAIHKDWRTYYSNGQPYYYNLVTRKTQWEAPIA